MQAMVILALVVVAEGQSLLATPIATISRADLMDAAYTGIGVAASMAGAATGMVTVADTSLVLLEGAEGSIDAGNDIAEQRLLMITSSREQLEKLRAAGRLHRGDPAYEAMRWRLQRESAIVFPRTRDFVTRAMLSRGGLIAFGRASLAFGVRSFLGDRVVDLFGPGIRVRSLMSTYASRDRSVPRSAWKRSDRIARAFGQLIDELTEVAVGESLEVVQSVSEESPPREPPARPAALDVRARVEPKAVDARAKPVFVAAAKPPPEVARPIGRVVPVPPPVRLPAPVTGRFEPPATGTTRLDLPHDQAVAIDRDPRNWNK